MERLLNKRCVYRYASFFCSFLSNHYTIHKINEEAFCYDRTFQLNDNIRLFYVFAAAIKTKHCKPAHIQRAGFFSLTY